MGTKKNKFFTDPNLKKKFKRSAPLKSYLKNNSNFYKTFFYHKPDYNKINLVESMK